jgi:hypothetical protein
MNERSLALRYLPRFLADENEPFPIVAVGFSVLYKSGPSPTFNRELSLPAKARCVIEYAVYFDFDIQHLYDLEHVWVYVGANGELLNAESSAHGGIVNCLRLAEPPEGGARLKLYLQPGKHAVLPRGELALLYPSHPDSCGRLAGKDGVLAPDMFGGAIVVPAGAGDAVEAYIKAKYSFVPTLRYAPAQCGENPVMDMDMLLEMIPKRINALISEITAR